MKKNTTKKNANKIVKRLNKINETLSSLDISINKEKGPVYSLDNIYKIASILMIFVVIFGYVYTVIPIYQKELLEENVAQLKKDINSYENSISNHQLELRELNLEKLEISKKISELQNENEFANTKLITANKNLTESITRNKKIEQNLVELESEYYNLYKKVFVGDFPIDYSTYYFINYIRVNHNFFEVPEHVGNNLKEAFIQPKDVALKQLEKLKSELQIEKDSHFKKLKKKIVSDYEKGIAKFEKSLECQIPSFDIWQQKYINVSNSFDSKSIIDNCVNDLFEQRIKKEKWKGKELEDLKQSNIWVELEDSHKQFCNIQPTKLIATEFEKSWRKAVKPCNDRILDVNQIVLGNKNVDGKIVSIDESYPTVEMINTLINERVESIWIY